MTINADGRTLQIVKRLLSISRDILQDLTYFGPAAYVSEALDSIEEAAAERQDKPDDL